MTHDETTTVRIDFLTRKRLKLLAIHFNENMTETLHRIVGKEFRNEFANEPRRESRKRGSSNT